MFWGLIMEPNKRYSQTVEKSFHVSMATLDVASADDNVVQVTVRYDDTNYLLCSLKKGSVWQVPLDLHFQEGTKIAFTCNGHSHVHLTGYLIPEDDIDSMDELEEEEEEEEEEDDEKVPQLVDKQSKRKAIDLPKGNRKVKRVKHEAESSDEDDAELDGINDDVEDSDDEEEEEEGDESLLNEENDSDEDDEDDDDDDDEDEEEEEEEEEQVQKKSKKQQQQQQQQQGKKNKQAQQQQEQQQKKKQDKQKLVNGKDVKQDQQNVKQDQQNNKQQKKNKGEQQQQQNASNEQKKRVIEGGVQIKDIKPGNGAPAKAGRFVSVYYVGRLQNGKKFDATTQGDGFKFRLGKGEVIKGWDIGIAGMKVGGKRQITIPPSMAYGAKGSPPAIPGNSTLVFDVELKNVH